ncbi:kinase domain protein [Teladorsagia circumcincta]|uniref:cyclin-dependent kinase n=1 Tax=Teladorsagia circumcincta TaxID=45464 RepID=A0A2G9TW35_TELCI|nr:kinase domain protein [Teladorsagia circumcincta]
MTSCDLAKFDGLKKIGEGTYGVVFKGVHKRSGKQVALKKISLERDNEGVPSTCIREICLLKDLNHRNIVRLYDVIHSELLVAATPSACVLSHTKGFTSGPETSESSRRQQWCDQISRFRTCQILLGGRYYSTAIDVWSLGCIFSEMVSGSPLFAGDSEIDQLFRIFKILGTPTPEIWAGVEKLQDYKRSFPRWTYNEKALVAATSPMTEDGVDLLKEMLRYPPESRITAKSALGHRYLRDVVLQPPEVTPLLRPPASFTTASPTGGTAETHHQHDF